MPDQQQRRITIANLKGGTSKTTTTAYLAHALADAGRQVLAVDADPPGSLLRWSELASWQLPVVGLAVRDLHKRIGAISRSYDTVLIDTPPLEEQAGVVYAALRAATDVVIPVSPTTMELDRLTPILVALAEVEPLRHEPPRVVVMLTRVVSSAASGQAAREAIGALDLRVLKTAIPRREHYAQAFGGPVVLAPGDPYALAAQEISAMASEVTP